MTNAKPLSADMEFEHADDCPRNRDCDETPVSGECLSHELEGCPKCECSISALDAARAERDARFTEDEVRTVIDKAACDDLTTDEIIARIRAARSGRKP